MPDISQPLPNIGQIGSMWTNGQHQREWGQRRPACRSMLCSCLPTFGQQLATFLLISAQLGRTWPSIDRSRVNLDQLCQDWPDLNSCSYFSTTSGQVCVSDWTASKRGGITGCNFREFEGCVGLSLGDVTASRAERAAPTPLRLRDETRHFVAAPALYPSPR